VLDDDRLLARVHATRFLLVDQLCDFIWSNNGGNLIQMTWNELFVMTATVFGGSFHWSYSMLFRFNKNCRQFGRHPGHVTVSVSYRNWGRHDIRTGYAEIVVGIFDVVP
jgi:hypothetical protein